MDKELRIKTDRFDTPESIIRLQKSLINALVALATEDSDNSLSAVQLGWLLLDLLPDEYEVEMQRSEACPVSCDEGIIKRQQRIIKKLRSENRSLTYRYWSYRRMLHMAENHLSKDLSKGQDDPLFEALIGTINELGLDIELLTGFLEAGLENLYNGDGQDVLSITLNQLQAETGEKLLSLLKNLGKGYDPICDSGQ